MWWWQPSSQIFLLLLLTKLYYIPWSLSFHNGYLPKAFPRWPGSLGTIADPLLFSFVLGPLTQAQQSIWPSSGFYLSLGTAQNVIYLLGFPIAIIVPQNSISFFADESGVLISALMPCTLKEYSHGVTSFHVLWASSWRICIRNASFIASHSALSPMFYDAMKILRQRFSMEFWARTFPLTLNFLYKGCREPCPPFSKSLVS